MKPSRFQTMLIISTLVIILESFSFIQKVNSEALNNYSVDDTLYFFKGNDISNSYLVIKNENVNAGQIYSIEDGVLIYNTLEQAYLRTKVEFENYKLHVEWRWMTADEKGNSGILIHIQKPDSVWPKCMQVQLKKDNAGDLLTMSGATSDQTIGKPKETGVKFSPSNEKPGIEWNSCDIFCKGDSITVYINGLLQNVGTNMNIKRGAAALQLEGRPILFRNVFLIKQ